MRFTTSLTLIVSVFCAAILPTPTVGQTIPGAYIVVFKPGTPDSILQNALNGLRRRQDSGSAGSIIIGASYHIGDFKAYAAQLDTAAVDMLENDPNVAFVEQEQWFSATWKTETQNNAPWGLYRMSHPFAPDSNDPAPYLYDATRDGEGVNVYVVDTGVYTEHSEFQGRAILGVDFIDNSTDTPALNGHGTHVAGSIAGVTYGVAKRANIISVRVLNVNATGPTSGIMNGIAWAARDAAMKGGAPSVINLSLVGGKSNALNQAATAAVNQGMTVAVAAGNNNADASNYSPCSAEGVICVGSVNGSDYKSSFSNYGSSLKVFVPGSNILSSWNTGSDATRSLSGTSMSSAYASGMAAYILSTNPRWKPSQVANWMQQNAIPCTVTGLAAGDVSSPNKVLYNGAKGAAPYYQCVYKGQGGLAAVAGALGGKKNS